MSVKKNGRDFFRSLSIVLISLFLLQSQHGFAQKAPESFVKHPDWSRNLSIYEVNVRQYSKGGTFKELEGRLPELKDMGLGILWLMPINPIGEKNRKGTLGSYYSVKNYLAVNPEFGTMDDFKSLVKAAHGLGMYVIIDWVANHTSWDNRLAALHPEYYKKDSSGNFVPPVPDWKDVIQLDYSNRDLWNYMKDALAFWVKECDIDGYRCDVADMVPVAFWDFARAELDKIKPVFMLAEAETPAQQVKAFDMSYGWNLYHLFNDIAKMKKDATDIDKYFKAQDTLFPKDAYRMYFTSNHDENSWNGTEFERLGKGVEAFSVVNFTVKGMPLLYSGQEAGLNKRLNFFERDPIEWKPSKFRSFYTTLIKLKLDNKALHNGDDGGEMVRIPTTNDKAVYSFLREKDGDRVITVANLTSKAQRVTLTLPRMAGEYKDLFTGKKVTLKDKKGLNLKAWEYMVLVK